MPDHVKPLADHPQLETISISLSGGKEARVTEYRVYNFKRWRNGTVIRGDVFGLIDVLWLSGLVLSWGSTQRDISELSGAATRLCHSTNALWAVGLVCFVIRQCTRTIYQSIIALPDQGLQLETTRGVSLGLPFRSPTDRFFIPLTTSSTFIPLSQISTVIINEGLRRWMVEYYLAIVKIGGSGIVIGFDTVRPPVAVLKEIYHGLRELLFDEYHE